MRDELEVTYSLAFKVWWAIMWRTLPLALLAGVALGFVFGIASAVTGLMLLPMPSLGCRDDGRYGFWV